MNRLLSAALLLALVGPSDGGADAAWATAAVAQLNALLEAPNRERAGSADRLVSEHVALDEFAATTFGDYLEKSLDAYRSLLSSSRFTHLVEHYRSRLARPTSTASAPTWPSNSLPRAGTACAWIASQ